MKTIVLVSLAGLASGAMAQVGTGLIEWQVSADGGLTWASGPTEVPPEQGAVLVRARASWSNDGRMHAFAGAQFDVVVRGAAPGDAVTNARRPWPFYTNVDQTIVVRRFGDVLKVDDVRDTLPPGEGTRGVFPGQLVGQFGTNFTSANPATIFEFSLMLDGTPGDRDLWSLYIAPPGGNTLDRVMRIYNSSSGEQNIPSTTTVGATVRVIPAPWTGAVLLGAWGTWGVWGRCRRGGGPDEKGDRHPGGRAGEAGVDRAVRIRKRALDRSGGDGRGGSPCGSPLPCRASRWPRSPAGRSARAFSSGRSPPMGA